MLEPGRQKPQHVGQVAVLAEVRRHEVVRLIDDQQIPGQLRPLMGLGGAAVGDELLQHVGLPEVVVRGDDPGQRAPGVGVQAHVLLQLVGGRLVDDVEAEGELVFHFLLPLGAQRGRRQDQHAPDAALAHQLGEDQARLDCLAQADVVGQ